ncbi:MAG TPA: SAM-dependent methyltransferase, partial [Actinomycetes bacterium]|nr:SAM-dependent methyltransferase [Actinomycetes bacterium]
MTDSSSAPGQQPPPTIDTSVPHSARIWNYWLGGKDNYPVGRAAGDQFREPSPGIVDVALMLLGILGHVGDYDEACSIVKRLLDPLPSGSYLALYDGTNIDEADVEAQERYNESGAVPYHLRSPEQIAG